MNKHSHSIFIIATTAIHFKISSIKQATRIKVQNGFTVHTAILITLEFQLMSYNFSLSTARHVTWTTQAVETRSSILPTTNSSILKFSWVFLLLLRSSQLYQHITWKLQFVTKASVSTHNTYFSRSTAAPTSHLLRPAVCTSPSFLLCSALRLHPTVHSLEYTVNLRSS